MDDRSRRCFLVECYHPGTTPGWIEEARSSIDELGRSTGCTCVQSILVPDDAVAFLIVRGPSLQAVLDVTASAGIVADRVVPSLVSP